MHLPAVVTVNFYFDSRRSLATAIALCGSGVGGLILPPLVDDAIVTYGYKAAARLGAFLTLLGVAAGLTFKHLPVRSNDRRLLDKAQILLDRSARNLRRTTSAPELRLRQQQVTFLVNRFNLEDKHMLKYLNMKLTKGLCRIANCLCVAYSLQFIFQLKSVFSELAKGNDMQYQADTYLGINLSYSKNSLTISPYGVYCVKEKTQSANISAWTAHVVFTKCTIF